MVKFWWVSLQFYTSTTLKMVILCSPDRPASQVLELWCVPPHLQKFVFIISSFSLVVVFCGVGKEAHGFPQVIGMLCTLMAVLATSFFFFLGAGASFSVGQTGLEIHCSSASAAQVLG